MIELTEDRAQQIMRGFQIPARPSMLIALQEELSKPEPDPVDLADIIARDVSLSAAVLKTVNSPVFGLNRQLADIRQAVIMLGGENVADLVTYYLLRQSLNGKAAISLEKFWDNTMEVASMARIVLDLLPGSPPCAPDAAYAFGLFRDCGIPLMAMKYADYKSVLMEANDSLQQVFTDVEERHYQTNHATVGYFVASSWNLPDSLCELVLRHHEPDFLGATDADDEQKSLYALIKIAANALSQYKYVKEDSEWPLARDAVMYHLGLSELDYQDLVGDATDIYHTQFGEL